jgi:hypothetical protein
MTVKKRIGVEQLSPRQRQVFDRINDGEIVVQWDSHLASAPRFKDTRDVVRIDTLERLENLGLIYRTRKLTDHGFVIFWHKPEIKIVV